MKTGYGIFGKPYEVMLRNDLHDPASVDHDLLRNMILLDDDSYSFLYGDPKLYDMRTHELYAFAQQFRGNTEKECVQNVLNYTSGIAEQYDTDFKDMLFGGTEKQILKRGTDWCSDMARAGTVLLQCLGIPCRILCLADTAKAYNGHVVGEAYYEDSWGIADFIYGYLLYDGKPVGAYEIQKNCSLLNSYPSSYRGLYSAVGISEYDPKDRNNRYPVSGPNAYYLRLMTSDHQGQWIMGEAES